MKARRFSCWLGAFWFLAALIGFAEKGSTDATPSATPFVGGVFRALIIGNNEYKDPEGMWMPLKTPIQDAEAISRVLQGEYGFSAENVLVLKNATRAQILSALTNLAKMSKDKDSVLIYYAGHGYSDAETKEAYWIPVDAVGKEDHTYVGNATIKTKLSVIADRARHVLLISDSCFSGTLLREGHRGIRATERNDQYYEKVAQKKSVQILAAGGLEYVDDNYKGSGHSPFTYYFLKQLEDNRDRYYSATELSTEVAKAVSNNVLQTPEKGILHGAGDNSGEFFFLNRKAMASAQKSPPATQAVAPSQAGVDPEAEMWALIKETNNPEDVRAFLASFPAGRLAPVAKLKLQQMERVATRGTPQGPDSSKQPDRPPSNGPKLALFPAFFENEGKRAYGKTLELIGEILVQSGGFSQIQSCYPFRENPGIAKIRKDLRSENLWKKGGLFSLPEPDARQVCEDAKALGVEVVLMYYVDVQRGGSRLAVYAVDVPKQKVHVAKDTNIMWRLDGDHVTKTLTEKAIEEYRQSR